MSDYLTTGQDRHLAYRKTEGQGPCVVFCGGLKSDMEGTKALHLEAWAQARGQAFLRFDYSGHGTSGGAYEEGGIGDWHEDTLAVLEALTEGPVVIVGSSMGGWQALLAARAVPERIGAMVTIAAAPDFTEDGWWAEFSEDDRRRVMQEGRVELPSDYMEPYVVTRRMIEDGRRHLVMRAPLDLPFPVRFLQGTDDTAVSVGTAVRLLQHATGDDMRLSLVKGADHRFSEPDDLDQIVQSVEEVIERMRQV